jgi:PTH1 family peptidyl-tRNA hydrolase
MYLIVGLGNPGEKYTFTRHNVGFLFIDYLCQKEKIALNKNKYRALFGKDGWRGRK